MTLGEKIRLNRKKKGMSQEDLANLLNVSRQAVQKWESGASTPELDKLVEISNVFEVSMDWLTKDIEAKSETVIQEPMKESITKPKILDRGTYRLIKVWIIIGIIFTPLMFTGQFFLNNPTQSPFALFGLLMFAITIPLGVTTIHRLKIARSKSPLIGWGIVTMIFVSFIGGLLILCLHSNKFVEESNVASEEKATKDKKNLPESVKKKIKVWNYISLFLRFALCGISLTVFIMIFMEQLDFSIHFFEVGGMGVGFAGYLIQIFTTVYVLLILGLTKKEKFSIFYLILPIILYAISGSLIASMYNSAVPYSDKVTGLSGCAIASMALCFASYAPVIILIVTHILLKKYVNIDLESK